MNEEIKYGALYIVATPLGNLGDITFRAVETLKSSALIAAEDTRRTRKLLSHFGVKARLISYREQNHAKAWTLIRRALQSGDDVSLVSDAGTPGVSDPGRLLVSEADQFGARVIPIPGPSAAAAAASVSGLPTDRYIFAGYLPSKPKQRRAFIENLKNFPFTLILYETPHRIEAALQDMLEILGARGATVCREMTKINEELIRGDLAEVLASITNRPSPVKGEFTIVLAGAEESAQEMLSEDDLRNLIENDDRPVKEIVADFAGALPISRSDLYRLVLEVKRNTGGNLF